MNVIELVEHAKKYAEELGAIKVALDRAGVISGDFDGSYTLVQRIEALEKERAHYAAEASRLIQLAVKDGKEITQLKSKIESLQEKIIELELFSQADEIKFRIACDQRDAYHADLYRAQERIEQLEGANDD